METKYKNLVEKKSIKNYLVSVWFIYKVIQKYINNVLGGGINKIKVVSGFEIEVEVVPKNLYPILYFLNKHTYCQYKVLVDVVCYDVVCSTQRFSVVYNILSVIYGSRITIISSIDDRCGLLSLLGIYKSIGWCEREIFDFFGIYFFENKDLRRILTDYGFKGFPLRKDFPFTGFIDAYYDDSQKIICYRVLELSQEYRDFKLKSMWMHNLNL